MRHPPGFPWRERVVPALACGALVTGLFGQACGTPSSEIDGGDLLGVFARDGGADGGPDAAKPDGGRKKASDAGADAATPTDAGAPDASAPIDGGASVRAPIEGVCVAPDGQPNHDIRRTVGRPACRGAQIMEWKDADGAPRYACVIAPPGVETRAPLPVVLFFHGPQDDPTAVDKKTSLRKHGASFSLTGDPAHTGFIVLAPQGRSLKRGRYGAIFDTDYTGADNVDVAAVDHFLGELEAKNLVDRRRIYALGASWGGHMAATYAMMRPDRVAAFAAYATDTPHGSWSCAGPPPPAMVLYRACDGFVSCESVERWLRARDGQGAETAWLRLGEVGEEEPNCAVRNKCSPKKGEMNHFRWPKTREADILRFFARHALGTR